MNRRKIRKRYVAGALALLLAVSGAHLTSVSAAEALDFKNNTCSLTLETTGIEFASELAEAREIPVKLYKVASMDEAAEFTVDTENYKDVEIVDHGENAAEWATEWKKLAQTVTKQIEASEKDGSKLIKPTTTVSMSPVTENGKKFSRGTASNLQPGLYLVKAENVKCGNYEYFFSPYIISVPTSEYRMVDENGDGYKVGKDEWLYNVKVGLKPARKPLEGDLVIQKILNTYNESLGEVTFVFEVTGREPGTGKVIYSNVVSINYDKDTKNGSQSVKITGLPAGTEVTVKEVYSGASYTASVSEGTTTIKPEEEVTVSLVNDYGDKVNKGYGIVNHFDFVGDNEVTDENGNLVVKGHYEWKQYHKDSVDAGVTGKGEAPEKKTEQTKPDKQ